MESISRASFFYGGNISGSSLLVEVERGKGEGKGEGGDRQADVGVS